MKYPTLTEIPTSRDMVQVFGGYNHNLRIGEGEFYDMKNMTSQNYPVLSPRDKRGIYTDTTEKPQGMIAKDALCYVKGSKFVLGEYEIEMDLSTAAEDCPKQLISMGAYVIILPDKKYINTADTTDKGLIEASFTTVNPVSFTLCTIEGAAYEIVHSGTTAPAIPEELTSPLYWLDTSTSPHALKCWAESSSMWVTIGTTYIKIESTGIGGAFNQYDGVTISGLADAEITLNETDENGNPIKIEDESLAAIDGNFVVWAQGDDYLVVVGMLNQSRTITNNITISRKMPEMDFVVESENRLWGCRYGTDNNDNVVNEIYASKLGDFWNWNCFMGVSTDSYVASVGTDGQFTGAITHLGYPIFFKEHNMHKVYGNYPANYQVQTTACRGVQEGCGRSLAIVNEMLYYKSRNAVCAYDGSLPTEISEALGDIVYSDAVGGGHNNKYYVSMRDASGVYHLFVYDTLRGIWHKEDNTHAEAFCSCRGEMLFIDNADGKIKSMNGGNNLESAPVQWMAETGVLTTDMPDKKYISRMVVRMSLDIGTRARFYIQYDSQGDWEHLFTMTGNNLRSFAIPIRPKRCDHFRLRIEGEGNARIYSFAKTIEQGSDY